VIPRANRPEVKVRSVLRKSEEEGKPLSILVHHVADSTCVYIVIPAELCNYLRMAISEQRRIDAAYGAADGSTNTLFSTSILNTSTSGTSGLKDDDIKLVLPPEPALLLGKNPKGKPVRKFRHNTKVSVVMILRIHPADSSRVQTVYYDKGGVINALAVNRTLANHSVYSQRFSRIYQIIIIAYRCRPHSSAALSTYSRYRLGQ
jgi:hypothetical protein